MTRTPRAMTLLGRRSPLAQALSLALAFIMLTNVSCKRSKTAEPVTTKKAAAAVPGGPLDKGWPRVYTVDGNEITLQQPQVDEWQNYTTLLARLAVTVRLKDVTDEVNGVVELRAATATDHAARLVTLYRPEILAIRFPGIPPDLAAKAEAAVRAIPPAKEATEIALDRVLAYVEKGQAGARDAAVNLDPPPIFYSDREAILLSFLGEPRFSPIEGTSLEFGLNTNWDVIRDPKSGDAFLLYRESWLTTRDVVNGPWVAASQLPPDMKRLPKDEVWDRVSKSVPGQALAAVPRVFVTTTPGELIITSGRPQFTPIPGTQLASVSNSENTLFYHQVDQQFYFLAAGRWFRARDLAGPWSAATKTLPADFAAIPKDNPGAWVLASVPGTEEAADAVLLASIPKTGVVNRAEAKADVVYDGEPKFEPIEKTTVKYAVNTANDVFLVAARYYLCQDGVWFVGSSATGPWAVADSVPVEIYTIPATSPKYNVTYVKVYDSTPTTVTCGYTSGYSGEVVAAGIVMFGLGMAVAHNASHYYYGYYPPYYWGYGPRPMPYYGHAHYYASPHGYGWSAHGPYGGAGYGARYNPATGVYSRGGYAYGPGGGSAYRAGYNPRTGAYGAQRGGYNAYGESWSQTAVRKGDDWARGGRYSNDDGTVGGFRTSSGAAGAGYSGDNGSGFVVRGSNGNVYAGKDGEVYRRGEGGNWSNANASASASSYQKGGGTAGVSSTASSRTAGQASTKATSQKPLAANTAVRPNTANAGAAASSSKLSGGFGASPSGERAATASPSSATRTPAGNSYAGGADRTAPSADVTSSLNRDYQARTTGDQKASRSASSSSYGGASSAPSQGGRSGGRSPGGAARGGGRRN